MRPLTRAVLERIDGRQYPAYRDLKGAWQLGALELLIDHVQGDPYAAPSRLRVRVSTDLGERASPRSVRVATEDFLLRRIGAALARHSGRTGSGKSGALQIYVPGPEICERSALRLSRDGVVEVRFTAGLPARGRRVLGRQAWEMFSQSVAQAMACLHLSEAHAAGLKAHIHSVQTQRRLRSQLAPHGLIAFIADGSVLPRRSGIDTGPMPDAVPFTAPEELAVTLDAPEGPVRGLGIRRGVTLIVGGGFHGKSTVLQALQQGHLDHIPGDGREAVVAHPDTVKVRAEDGRPVRGVDISAFLSGLPGGWSTAPFSTEDASGSTSQASAIAEALESGARVLLIDEDTSATNLLVRDDRMRQLIPRDQEPITPFVERVQQLASAGVSTIMVVGGVGDYLAVADTVIGMSHYRPQDLTTRAAALAGPAPKAPSPLPVTRPRVPSRDGLEPGKIRARDTRAVRYGAHEIELTAVEQVLDAAHAWTLGQALRFLYEELVNDHRSVQQLLNALEAILDDEGVEALSPSREPSGGLIRPRRHEVAAALNRLRSLEVRSPDR